MKLDPRIKKGCRPFSVFDTKAARKFIGKRGYFTDHLYQYSNLSDVTIDILKTVSLDEKEYMPYITKITAWEFFLPIDWVEETKEPKEADTNK